jgi:hypothetical protein
MSGTLDSDATRWDQRRAWREHRKKSTFTPHPPEFWRAHGLPTDAEIIERGKAIERAFRGRADRKTFPGGDHADRKPAPVVNRANYVMGQFAEREACLRLKLPMPGKGKHLMIHGIGTLDIKSGRVTEGGQMCSLRVPVAHLWKPINAYAVLSHHEATRETTPVGWATRAEILAVPPTPGHKGEPTHVLGYRELRSWESLRRLVANEPTQADLF